MAPAAPTQVLQLPQLTGAGLRHGFTTRATGDFSHAGLQTAAGRESLRRLGEVVGFDPELLVSAEQVHGNTVAVVHLCENCGPGRRIPHTDGLISEEAWPLMITTADCYPVILYEPREDMVAVVHCGWRGTVAGILPRAIQRLVRESGAGPSGMYAGIGPGICGACYEVGEEVVQAARAAGLGAHVSADADLARHRFDIAGALRQQLLDAGFRSEHLESVGRCTFEDPEFPSHRRDRTPVRMATVAIAGGPPASH